MGEGWLDVKKFTSELADNLRSRQIRVDRILLFGSHARGQATEESDLDLIVVSPDFGENAVTDFSAIYRSLPMRTFDVDAIPCSPNEIDSVEPGTFLAYALAEGKVIYEGAALVK